MTRPRSYTGAIYGQAINSVPSSTLETLAIEPPEWYADALCAQVGGNDWFPEKDGERRGAARDAKRVCNGIPGRTPPCPVRDQCLKYALANEERHGIWAGLTWYERKRLLRGAS